MVISFSRVCVDETRPRADKLRNRELILDAAALIMAREPDPTIVEIADAAGLSRATVYRSFPSVDAIRAALLAEAQGIGTRLIEALLNQALREEPLPSVGMLDQMLDHSRTSLPIKHRWTTAIGSEGIQDVAMIREFVPVTAAMLKRGQQGGGVRADINAEAAAEAIVSLCVYCARRIHAEGASLEYAMGMITPLYDGLRG